MTTLLSLLMTFAQAGNTLLLPKYPKFLDECITYYNSLPRGQGHWPIRNSGYLEVNRLTVGQDRISHANIGRKAKERVEAGDIHVGDHGKIRLKHDTGKSTMPLEEAISVVLSPFGYVIVDGHHDFMLSLYVEAETVPVKVVGDYSRLSPREFWQTLGDKKLSYLSRIPQALASRTPELSELVDTPNRYLAALLTAKFTIVGGKITHFKGNPKAVVWVKINDGVPFKEFEIAQVLSDAGIEYQDKWGDDVPKKIVTKSRNILTAAAEKLGIRVLTESEAKKIEKDKIQRLVCDLVY